MSGSDESCSFVNLKKGGEIFPVHKALLLKNADVFRYDKGLLENDEYEVRSQVPRSVFVDFVEMIEGGSISLSEDNCESFWLLSKEFDFGLLCVECTSFMKSRWPTGFSRITRCWLGRPDGPGVPVCSGPHVTITVKGHSRTYGVLRSHNEIKDFALSLAKAKEECIVIEGLDDTDRIVEKAVETVYWNTFTTLPDDDMKIPFLALILWEIRAFLYEYCIDASIRCSNGLNSIAPTGFDKARLLLLSQCNPVDPDGFVPGPLADWTVVGAAINMLKSEKNGKQKDAKELLEQLKRNGRYRALLGKWNDADGRTKE
jgi:hypothetical protein